MNLGERLCKWGKKKCGQFFTHISSFIQQQKIHTGGDSLVSAANVGDSLAR